MYERDYIHNEFYTFIHVHSDRYVAINKIQNNTDYHYPILSMALSLLPSIIHTTTIIISVIIIADTIPIPNSTLSIPIAQTKRIDSLKRQSNKANAKKALKQHTPRCTRPTLHQQTPQTTPFFLFRNCKHDKARRKHAERANYSTHDVCNLVPGHATLVCKKTGSWKERGREKKNNKNKMQ